MSAIETAKKHFDGLKGLRIEVPEWGEPDAPLVVLYDCPSMRELHGFNEKAKGNAHLAMCYLITRQARGEDGTKLFDDADAQALYAHADPAVVSRIGAQMQLKFTVAEAAKN